MRARVRNIKKVVMHTHEIGDLRTLNIATIDSFAAIYTRARGCFICLCKSIWVVPRAVVASDVFYEI